MEGIEISCDVQTAEAVINIGAMTEAFIRARVEAKGLSEDIDAVGVSSGRSASAMQGLQVTTAETGEATQGFAQATGQAGQQQTTFNTQLNQTNTTLTQVNVTLEQTNIEINEAAAAEREAQSAASSWTIGLTAGIGAVIALLDAFIERCKEANEAVKALDESRMKSLATDQDIARRLNIDERKAAAVVARTAIGASASTETARAAVAATAEAGGVVGLDPSRQGSEGDKYAQEAAKIATITGMSADALTKLLKIDVANGGGTAKSLDDLANKILNGMPKGEDPGKYISAAVAGVLGELSRGEKAEDALAVLSVITPKMRDPDAGGQAVRQLRMLSERGTKQSNAFFAERAAEMGVTNVAPVTDDDVDAAADAAVTPGGKRLADRRRALADEQRKVTLERRKIITTFKPEQRAAANERLRETDEHIAAERRDLEVTVAKVRADEQARRALAAFESLTPAQRLAQVIVPAAAAARTPEQQAALAAATSARNGDAIFALGSAGPSAIDAARAAMASGRNQVQERTERYRASETGKDTVAQTRREVDEFNATDEGTAFSQRLYQDAVSQRKIDSGGGVDTSSMLGIGKTILSSKDRGVITNYKNALEKEYDKIEGDKNLSRADHERLDGSYANIKGAADDYDWSTEDALGTLNEAATILGRVRSGFDQRMKNEGTGQRPIDQSTPAARDAAYAKAHPGWKPRDQAPAISSEDTGFQVSDITNTLLQGSEPAVPRDLIRDYVKSLAARPAAQPQAATAAPAAAANASDFAAPAAGGGDVHYHQHDHDNSQVHHHYQVNNYSNSSGVTIVGPGESQWDSMPSAMGDQSDLFKN